MKSKVKVVRASYLVAYGWPGLVLQLEEQEREGKGRIQEREGKVVRNRKKRRWWKRREKERIRGGDKDIEE